MGSDNAPGEGAEQQGHNCAIIWCAGCHSCAPLPRHCLPQGADCMLFSNLLEEDWGQGALLFYPHPGYPRRALSLLLFTTRGPGSEACRYLPLHRHTPWPVPLGGSVFDPRHRHSTGPPRFEPELHRSQSSAVAERERSSGNMETLHNDHHTSPRGGEMQGKRN